MPRDDSRRQRACGFRMMTPETSLPWIFYLILPPFYPLRGFVLTKAPQWVYYCQEGLIHCQCPWFCPLPSAVSILGQGFFFVGYKLQDSTHMLKGFLLAEFWIIPCSISHSATAGQTPANKAPFWAQFGSEGCRLAARVQSV